ncbi:MAG TPA: 3-oxoacyl-[acyl-carrier-protein] synthase III C-terminal domain-containing protein [Pirellulaceae bacterium]|nr:3-oxoacyl-[acyl-carrier-protein] synthase III C-terminal domain-containing protein [Pirellulaceae bacterium]
MIQPASPSIGIAAIATYEPPWVLGNEWFAGTIPRKFVHHTGIRSRPISREDEVTLAEGSVRNLVRDTGCDLADCAALVLASPSFVPRRAARKFLSVEEVRRESPQRAAHELASRLNLRAVPVWGINWFCSGYSKAFHVVLRRVLPRIELSKGQFVLVVTASRISRITDYSCQQTAGLFGDLATATLLSRTDSLKYPVHLELLYAAAEKRPVDGVFFDFHLRNSIPFPAEDGGRVVDPQRLVFSLDGMGIADVAPRAMAGAIAGGLSAAGISPSDVQFVIPHQAGTAIVRLAAMKIEALGISGEVINGHTETVGNVSSGSIPYTLHKLWPRLSGIIACPTAAVGNPGVAEVSQGCVLLRATPRHQQCARAA